MGVVTELIGGPLDGEEIDLDHVLHGIGECIDTSNIEQVVLAYLGHDESMHFATYTVRMWRAGLLALVYRADESEG